MELKDAYAEIADRALSSANANINADIQESATFFAYHAFESLGGALCSSMGSAYSMSHTGKINQFVAASTKGKLRHKIAWDVAYVGMLLSSLRNSCLYPELTSGDVRLPQDLITLNDAKRMVKRVGGVARKVKREL